jgi:hypothetical protein
VSCLGCSGELTEPRVISVLSKSGSLLAEYDAKDRELIHNT